jgi:hypothetical protein
MDQRCAGRDARGLRHRRGPRDPAAARRSAGFGPGRVAALAASRARARYKTEGPTAFRYAKEGSVSVFYWIDGQWGYALSGDIDKPALSRVANTVYRQLNP